MEVAVKKEIKTWRFKDNFVEHASLGRECKTWQEAIDLFWEQFWYLENNNMDWSRNMKLENKDPISIDCYSLPGNLAGNWYQENIDYTFDYEDAKVKNEVPLEVEEMERVLTEAQNDLANHDRTIGRIIVWSDCATGTMEWTWWGQWAHVILEFRDSCLEIEPFYK